MLTVASLLPIPVLLPLLAAGLALLVGPRPRVQQLISLLTMVTVLAVGIALAVQANTGPVVLDAGSWAAPIGITLVADRLSSLMLVVSQIVTLAVLIYSLAQNLADDDPDVPVAIYHPTYLILIAGVSNAFLTGDLFNLYVGFEILLAASFVLITLGGTRGRTRAGTVYVVVSLVSSMIFLAGIALTYAAAGTVNMAQLSTRLREIDPSVALTIQLVLLVAFGIKSAVFPLSAWLPDSYPTAPAPVTAVFAGLLTKVGIYALIRLQVLLFPGRGVDNLLTVVGIATMIVGILGALTQEDMRRLLSFTLVSHIGFMIWGLALVNRQGLASAIFYAAHHILVQTAMFLIIGLIERKRGTTSLRRLGGMAKAYPAIAILFFITALNLVGIPPLPGFLGKLGLAQAAVTHGGWQGWSLLAAGMVTSFLTLYAVVKVWNFAFWQQREDESLADTDPEKIRGRQRRAAKRRLDRAQATASLSEEMQAASRTKEEQRAQGTSTLMYAAAGTLVVVMLAMSVVGGRIYAYAASAALDQMDRSTYLHSVLSADGRGHGDSQYGRHLAPPELRDLGKEAEKASSDDAKRDDITQSTQVRIPAGGQWKVTWRPPLLPTTDQVWDENRPLLEVLRQVTEDYVLTHSNDTKAGGGN
ncbi:MAG: Na+/H+ antiporter subunit D [Actinomycetaceae bacterium]|nr:Na+/H+ antiporter subunit D [Actinomycetaceae bacterium]